MLSKWFYVFLLISIIQNTIADHKFIDVAKYNMVYYDPSTQIGLKGELQDDTRSPLPGIGFRGVKCNCQDLICGCCTGIHIDAFNFDRHACTNITYTPEDFTMKFKLIINEREILTGSISGKNPPPFCVPFYPPFLSFCMRFYDIYTSGKNLHACIDFETHVVRWPILILHFDCIKLGVDGISWIKPEDGSSVFQMAEVSKPEIYDEVDFESDNVVISSTHSSNLTPEEEANIGQLKL